MPSAVIPVVEDFAVMEANWYSIVAFLACDTQWRAVAGASGMIWLGLDYAACDVVIRRRTFPDYVFDDLHVIEHAVLPILNSGGDE